VGDFMGEWMQKVQESVQQIADFFKEAWQELKKVHWPSRKETYAATLVVIVVVVLISIFLAVVDFGLTKAIEAVID
jgi:preprotein translocase subunit SecE